jgi:hypothetical protein
MEARGLEEAQRDRCGLWSSRARLRRIAEAEGKEGGLAVVEESSRQGVLDSIPGMLDITNVLSPTPSGACNQYWPKLFT